LNELITLQESDSKSVLDLRTLSQLSSIQRDGRPGFMDQLIELFLITAQSLLRDLEQACRAEEVGALRAASHSLRSCSAAVGALHLAALCEALERMARSGAVSDSTAKVVAIAEEYNHVEAALTGSRVMLR
jgi:HPt (histidine-containing phosphotransfer) domain-containing protein